MAGGDEVKSLFSGGAFPGEEESGDGLLLSSPAKEEKPCWFRVLTISGKPAGLGFQCPKCHHGIRHSAPAKVFHCGAWEDAPRITTFLPTIRLGNGATLPRGFVKIGTW